MHYENALITAMAEPCRQIMDILKSETGIFKSMVKPMAHLMIRRFGPLCAKDA